MGKIKIFPTPEYKSKQPHDPAVPQLPATGILLGPSKSGKTVALISMILEQYRGCFERIYLFSPSINVDDGWRPVKKYIEETMKVNTDREQVYFENWDEAALRRIIDQQRKITQVSKQMKMKQLYQILILIDDFADSPNLHKRTGDSALDTLFVRGRHFQISTWVSTQKLRLISNAVRVNAQFFMAWRLRNQLEKDSLLEELTALVPKQELHAMYEEAVREPYSFLYIYLLNPRDDMFHIRFERKRVAGTDADFEFDVGETVVADTFLSTDRGTYLYWRDAALNSLNWAQLPVGAYTGARLAAWISSNFAAATYVESTNELFPSGASYPAGAAPTRPLSINHLLGPSFKEGGSQIFSFVVMNPYNELYLRCSSLANAADSVGPLGHDIIAKIICSQGVGYIMQSSTDDNHLVNLRGPITLRYLRFKLTDLDGNVVNLRGTSISAEAEEAKPMEAAPMRAMKQLLKTDRFEALMLRQFWKKFPSYNLNSLMRKRYEELMDAKAFNEWLSNRQLKQEGEAYADPMGRLTEAVNHRVPQLRWAGAERRQTLRAGDQLVRNTRESGVVPGFVPSKKPMEEQRVMGFRRRPDYGEVLAFINEGEPLNFPLPNRKATIYTSSHFYLDAFPQSTEPLVDNPRPHTDLGAAVEGDFGCAGVPDDSDASKALASNEGSRLRIKGLYSADEDGYRGRILPTQRLRRSCQTSTSETSFQQHFGSPGRSWPARRRNDHRSGRCWHIGAAVDSFARRNTARAADVLERRFLPPRSGPSLQIIGRPNETEELIVRAGQRAQDVECAAAQDIEQFAAEQAAAEGGELVPLLAETAEIGTQTAEAGGGLLGGLTAFGGAAGEAAGGAAAAAFPIAEGFGMPAGVATGGAAALAGGAVLGLYEGGRWLLGGNGGDAAPASSGSESADARTINNMQQGAPQERFSIRQPRVRQPIVASISSGDDAPTAQQQDQPRPQVQSGPAPRPRMPFGLSQAASSSESESYGPVRPRRQQRAEPSFNDLRRDALSQEPEAA
ncbi:hypothetical protein AK812_SmicGene22989 [Symbiodinium microadriaticum]|uniref:Uncharacterized protein n=1 Tax=Symbiodinium microadriaticum TaxID=2951 RepID=A0A1Q9DIF1_SYMMI|nr:hypothetical protein AK812_SmicGene22989 [Symbiodinium microadriaticum]